MSEKGKTATENKVEDITPEKNVFRFGWLQLLVRAVILIIISGTFSYLEATEVMNINDLNAQLLVPAVIGFSIALMNWRYARKLWIFIMPIWFATGVALAFAGIWLIQFFNYQTGNNELLDIFMRFFPFAISGQWIYGGYSRMTRRQSIVVQLLVVIWSIVMGALMFNLHDYFFILQAVYLAMLGIILSSIHLGLPPGVPRRKKILQN